MILRKLVLLLAVISGNCLACDNGKISDYINNNQGFLVQALSSDRISSGSTIFFHYTSKNDEHPDIIASYASDRCVANQSITFDTYSYDGSMANIESVFWGRGMYKINLFIIVSWNYNIDGVSTVGKYYSVFAYDYDKIKITKNEKITIKFKEGHDGFVNGKVVKYRFKTASDVLSYLENN